MRLGITLNVYKVVTDLTAIYNAYQRQDEEGFGKAYSNAVKDIASTVTSSAITAAALPVPIGPFVALFANYYADKAVDAVYENVFAKGVEASGRSLYTILQQGGNVPTEQNLPAAGDPPPSLIVFDPTSDGTSSTNLSAAGQAMYASAGSTSSGVVSTFIDATGNTDPGAYQAYVGWGDGNFSPGTVAALPGGGFSVSAANTYATAGIYTVSVLVVSNDGSIVSSYGAVTVSPAPVGGPTAGPTAALEAGDVDAGNAVGMTPYTFSLTFQDGGRISAASLAGSTVQVQPPSGPASRPK